ncbi:hypothetical protein B7463_g2187, partial [Scytalidium lignicola]
MFSPTMEDTSDYSLTALPAHVNAVKDRLLDFNRFLSRQAVMFLLEDGQLREDEDIFIPPYAYTIDGVKESQQARYKEFIETTKALTRNSKKLKNQFAQISEWHQLFQSVMTNQVDDFCCSHSCLLGTVSCVADQIWDANLDTNQSLPTNPNPDLCFGFILHDIKDQNNSQFTNDPFLRNFTSSTLSQLSMKGLRYVPTSTPSMNNARMKKGIKKSKYQPQCFPWCVVQLSGFEKTASNEEIDNLGLETALQVSNAASKALSMFEILARHAEAKQNGEHIPPVVSITSVGPNTTVWLAFSDIIDDRYREHAMLEIWKGNITKIWDALQFCRIIQNMLAWSLNILKPKVSHYVDQWRLHCFSEVHNQSYPLEKDHEMAELISRVQERLHTLNISPIADLPNLVQQAVILQEVMKSITPVTTNPSIKSQEKDSSGCDNCTSAEIPNGHPTQNKATKLSFSYPYEFKTSDFEFRQKRLSLSVRRHLGVSQAVPFPSQFVAKYFQLSFRVKVWWALIDTDVEEIEEKYKRWEGLTREKHWWEMEKPGPMLLDTKIPWKNSSIRVRLPLPRF